MNKKYTIDQLRQVKGIGEKTIERIIEQFDDSNYVSKYNPDIHIEPNTLVHGDMLEVMNGIPDGSVDMILTDLPYGTSACGWDVIIPFDKMWKQYHRVIKDTGSIVLFGSEPFTSLLITSNIEFYKYNWVWVKDNASNFLNKNYQPGKITEDICVFGKGATSYSRGTQMKYNPILTSGKPYQITNKVNGLNNAVIRSDIQNVTTKNNGTRLPNNVLKFNREKNTVHQTQKPVELLEYLIKTYTNENDIVLDSTMGSGSTCVAAINTNRRYIGIELDQDYYNIAVERVEKAKG